MRVSSFRRLLGTAVGAFLLLIGLPPATAQATTTLSSAPVADAHVMAAYPNSNFGTSTMLRLKGSPVIRTYLRFGVSGTLGSVTRATLRLFSSSTSTTGFTVHAVSANKWGEKLITYKNAPIYASTATDASGPVAANGWTSVDVTPLVRGDQLVSFALVTTGTQIYLSSRESGASTAPQLVVETTDTVAPTAPGNLTASAAGSARIDLSWSQSSDNVAVSGYRISRTGGGGSTTIDTGGPGTTYSDTGLSPSTTYTYTVRAYDAAGNESAASNSDSATTQDAPDTSPPTAPTNLDATAPTPQEVDLTWSASTDDRAVTGYKVLRDDGTNPVVVVDTGSTNLSYVDANVTPDTQYSYSVKAYDAAGNISDPSAPASVHTPARPPTCVGVQLSPGDDIQAAITANGSGTAFCLASGTYRLGKALVPLANDSFTGAAGATLNGSVVIDGFVPSGQSWVADGQLPLNPTVSGQCATGTACQYSEAVFIDGRPLDRVMVQTDVGPGKFYEDYSNNRIYVGDDPTGAKIEQAKAKQALNGSASGVLIKGLTVEKFADNAQQAAVKVNDPSTGWTIRDSEIRLCHGAGLGITHASQALNNYLHDNGQYGMTAQGSGGLVENNEIANNNLAGFDTQWAAGGAKFAGTTNLTVRGNYVHDNLGNGFWDDHDSIGTLYENNRIVHNSKSGIVHEISYDAVIRNNTVNNNGYAGGSVFSTGGIYINSSSNVEIYGNTLSGNRNGIALFQALLTAPRDTGKFGPHEVHDVYVHDNAETLGNGYTGMVQKVNDPTYFTARNNRFAGNTYVVNCAQATHWNWMDKQNTWDEWLLFGQDTLGSSSCA